MTIQAPGIFPHFLFGNSAIEFFCALWINRPSYKTTFVQDGLLKLAEKPQLKFKMADLSDESNTQHLTGNHGKEKLF